MHNIPLRMKAGYSEGEQIEMQNKANGTDVSVIFFCFDALNITYLNESRYRIYGNKDSVIHL